VFQQRVRIGLIGWAECDADTGPNGHTVIAQSKGLAENVDKAPRQRRRLSRLVNADLHDSEFVPPETHHYVLAADILGKPFCNGTQERIACRMSQGIVDVFEVIEVKAKHCEAVGARPTI
jgi:hypothetical protein